VIVIENDRVANEFVLVHAIDCDDRDHDYHDDCDHDYENDFDFDCFASCLYHRFYHPLRHLSLSLSLSPFHFHFHFHHLCHASDLCISLSLFAEAPSSNEPECDEDA